MADLVLRGFQQVRVQGMPTGGAYDEMSYPKLGWHTWEGFDWAAAEVAFRRYPPHLAVFPPWPGLERHVGRRQYVPLNRHAYAFAGSESDDEYVVQLEVAGKAADMRRAPDVVLEWLATEVVAPIEKAVGVPRVVVRHGFRDTVDYVGRYPLASKRSAIRLTPAELRAFSGHLGHQHMPGDDDPNDGDDSGDAHWDPGALPIVRILAHLDKEDSMLAVIAHVAATYRSIRNARGVKGAAAEPDPGGLANWTSQFLAAEHDGEVAGDGSGPLRAAAVHSRLVAALKAER